MSKGLQWVIGMGVVLVVAAVIMAGLAPFVLPRLGLAMAPQFTGPMGMYGQHMPFRPGFMFGMGGRMPFRGFFGLAGCIWPLLLAALIVLAISALSRRPAPYAAQPPMAQAPVAPAMPATPASAGACQPGGPRQLWPAAAGGLAALPQLRHTRRAIGAAQSVRTIWLRSGPTEIRLTGTPVSSSIRAT